MSVPFSPGAFSTQENYSYVSAYNAHMPDIQEELILAFGRQRLIDLLTVFDLKAPTYGLEFSHFEQDRIKPKIQATNGGAGGAGAAVVFSLSTAAFADTPLNVPPYDSSSTVTDKSNPVKVGDLLLIKPAAGTLTNITAYIRALVTAVAPGTGASGEFTAQPIISTEAIPSIPSATEIMIYGSAYGEGSNRPSPLTIKDTERKGNVQIQKLTREITNIERCIKRWYEHNGSKYALIEKEFEFMDIFQDQREQTFLIGQEMSNTTLFDTFATSDTPIALTKGLIPTILERGNTHNYNSVSGFTISDFYDIVTILDKQKGSKQNLFCTGIELRGNIDRELGDQFKAGGITYGNFKMSEEKYVSLQFKNINVNGYDFHLKTLDAFNDLQGFGANGYGFPFDGFILPMDDRYDSKTGEQAPSVRIRYLQTEGQVSQEVTVDFIDLRKYGDTGKDVIEARYTSYSGIQVYAANRMFYVSRV